MGEFKKLGRSARLATAIAACLAGPAWAQTDAGQTDTSAGQRAANDGGTTGTSEIVVTGTQFRGKATPLKLSIDPASDAASVTALSAEDIARQPIATNIDIFRSIPGVQVGDFGQVGIAQGVSLRGWPGANDSSALAFYFDGVQRNEGSGTGANGYLDTNPYIPEVIRSLTVVKGPFDTRYGGNFAQAGSAVLTSADMLPTGVSLSGGSYGHVRGLLTYGTGSATGLGFYTAIQGLRDGGYQRNSDQKQLATFSKLGVPVGDGRLTFSLQTFNLKFGSPGYLDLSDIESGAISPKSDVNDTDGGHKNEYVGVAQYKVGDDRQGLEVTAFGLHELRTRYATFTPYPQSFTKNNRTDYGFNVEPHGTVNLFGIDTQILAGFGARHDEIHDTTLPSTDREKITEPDPADLYGYQRASIGQTQVSAYGQAGIKPVDWLKLTAGGRYDLFDYSIHNQSYDATGNRFVEQNIKTNTGKATFKGSAVVQPLRVLTLYANYGQSVASPDAFRDLESNPDLEPSVLTSKEVGAAFNSANGRFHLQGNYYWTTFSNEVTFVGQTAINQGRTKRRGFDIDASAIAYRAEGVNVRVYGNYSKIHGRLADGELIPNVADWVASYGLRADIKTNGTDSLGVDLGQQWTGKQSYGDLSTGTFMSKANSRVSGQLSYTMPERHNLRLFADAIVYPGTRFGEFGFTLADRVYVTSLPRLRLQAGASVQF